MATDFRNPTSDIVETGTWAGGTATNRYLLVDDYPDSANPMADGIVHGTATAGHIQFGFTPFTVPEGATSISIQVLYYDFKGASQTNTIAAELRIGSTPTHHTASTHTPGNGNANIASRTDNFATNPKSTAAWTVDDVNGVGTNGLVGFGVVSTDANPTITITSIRLQVTFTPPPTVKTPPRPTGNIPTLSQGYAQSPSTSEAPEQWAGLISAWAPFLGQQGSILRDIQSGFHGTLTNFTLATAWTAGRHGLALEFDGSADYVSVPSIRTASGRITVSAWIKTTQTTAGYIFNDFSAGEVQAMRLGINVSQSDQVRMYAQNGSLATVSSDANSLGINDGLWHHILGTYNGAGFAEIYVDGYVRDTSTSGGMSAVNYSRTMIIGANESGASSFFDGWLDDLRIYNRVLTAKEAKELYQDPYAMYRLRRRRAFRVATAGGPTINVGDTVTLTDTPIIKGLIPVLTGADTATLTDVVTINLLLSAIGADTSTLSEQRVVNLILAPAVADLVSPTDTPTLKGLIPAATVSDLATVTDVATVTGLILVLAAADMATLTDDRTVSIPSAGVLLIPVNDAIALTDVATVTGLTLPILATDVSSVTDVVSVRGLIPAITTSETISLLDTPSVDLIESVLASDTASVSDLATVQGLTLPISAADTLTASELPTVAGLILILAGAEQVTLSDDRLVVLGVVGSLSPNVSDLITLTDILASINLISKPLIGDVATLTDTLSITGLIPAIATIETLTSTDNATPNLVSNIFAQETLTLSDISSVSGLIPAITAVETLTALESTAVNLVDTIQATETATLSDAATVRELSFIAAAETLTVADTPVVVVPPVIIVAETIAVTDDRFVIIPSASVHLVFVNDTLALTDTLLITGLTLQAIASDLSTVSDLASVAGLSLIVTTAEPLTTVDTPLVNLVESIVVSETVTLSETVTVRGLVLSLLTADSHTVSDLALVAGIVLLPTGADVVTLTDSRTVTLGIVGSLNPNVNDLLSLNDQGFIALLHQPQVQDLTTLTETVTVGLIDGISAAESLTVSDMVTVDGLVPPVLATETATMTDTATVQGLILAILSANNVTLTDDRTVLIPIAGIWQIPVADGPVILSDTSLLNLISNIRVAETLTLTDTSTTREVYPISQADQVTLTDLLLAQLLNQPKGSDSQTLTDAVTVTGLIATITSADLLTLTEQRIVSLSTRIAAAELVTITDTATLRGLTIPIIVSQSVQVSDTSTLQRSMLPIAVGNQVTLTESVDLLLIADVVSIPVSHISVPARDMSVTATVTMSHVQVTARDMSLTGSLVVRRVVVPARDMSLSALMTLSQVDVPVRDMSVQFAA